MKYSANHLQELLDDIDVGIVQFSPQNECIWVNRFAQKILGKQVRAGQFDLSEFFKFVFDHSLDWYSGDSPLLYDGQMQQGRVFHDIIAPPDGRSYIVKVQYKGERGTIAKLADITLVRNYTERLDDLHRHNTILAEAINSSSKGVIVADRGDLSCRILFINRAMEHVLPGEDAMASWIGQPLEIFLAAYFSETSEQWEKVVHEGGRAIFSRHFLDGEGKDIWMDMNLSSTNKTAHGDEYLIGFVSDVTQMRLQDIRLRQTGRLEAIGQLAGGIAHDFNNILSIIDGFARLAENPAGRSEQNITNYLAKIRQAAARGSGLTRQLLMFGEHRVLEDKVIEINSQINDVQGLLGPLLGPTIHVQVDIPEERYYVRGTPDNLSQIVMNLALNARDAMPDGGDLMIGLYGHPKEGREGIVMQISDTGCGIPHEIREKIFDPFFTTKQQGKGTGLGLSMVYALVRKMDGEIDFLSEMGQGTTFRIWLPCKEAANEAEKDRGESGGGSLVNKTVLLVDDEQDILEIMATILKDFGMNVMCAGNGTQALEIQDEYEGKIDFLLTDMVMPELGGIKLAELIHEVRPKTRILFMSGYPVRGDLSEIKLAEDAIFLTKPVNPDKLRKVMENMEENSRQGTKNLAMPHWASSE